MAIVMHPLVAAAFRCLIAQIRQPNIGTA